MPGHTDTEHRAAGRTALLVWTDGRAFYAGHSAFPRERKGQLRTAARKGGTSAFARYLRTVGADVGKWSVRWVPAGEAEQLAEQWRQAAAQSGALVFGQPVGTAVRPPGARAGGEAAARPAPALRPQVVQPVERGERPPAPATKPPGARAAPARWPVGPWVAPTCGLPVARCVQVSQPTKAAGQPVDRGESEWPDGFDWRAGLRRTREETAYIDRLLGLR